MLKDLFKISFFMIPVILLVLITNYVVDPGASFGFGDNEKTILKNLLAKKDHNLSFSEMNFKRVPVLKAFVKETNSKFEILAIGSSRAMTISNDIAPKRSFFNASISSCNLADMVAIYNLFEKNGKAPRELVLSFDENFFEYEYPKLQYKELSNDYLQMLAKLNLNPKEYFDPALQEKPLSKLEPLLPLISISYFQSSLKMIYLKIFQKNKTKQNSSEHGIKYADGSHQWDHKLLKRKGQEKLNFIYGKRIAEHIKDPVKEVPIINPKSDLLLQNFVNYLRSKGVKVIFYLPPYHPVYFRFKASKYKKNISTLVLTEHYLKRFAQLKNVPIVGYFEPFKHRVDANDNDLVDYHHPTRECSTKLLGAYFGEESNAI